ncbi:retrovirus-related Pol polyprotein from transposon 297 [Trichonephila clavipes]|uniref:RNA-directed DNA polymerase n=1 Tax=Trichonephila clavipes TaxID=2585209 RepID=A0A8X6W1S2_TRICX|nr:retrovirus-related Pol polyprotein from transposon 297 [Trichonephila clavipes]
MFKSDVKVTLVRAKARVAPLKPLSIPRLELMACCIGSRLANSIVNALNLPNLRITFWSDSTTALWWIKEKGSWWWEGPLWLRESPEYWPLGETPGDSEEVELERKKLKVVNIDLSRDAPPWHLYAISDYNKMVRVFSWILRFVNNCTLLNGKCKDSELSQSEIENSEKKLIRLVQSYYLPDAKSSNYIETYIDDEVKSLSSEPTPLPPDRVTDCAPFEIVGIDLAGPLFLKDGRKVWITLFTCAIYRAIHLELVNSLTSDAFLLALRCFIARRGRPRTIYCDNGTNFRGAFNDLSKLNWSKIVEETRTPKNIMEIYPTYCSLVGRLVGKAGPHCKKNCFKAYFGPLTYVSENPEELIPLTPSMFLISNKNSNIEDIEELNSNSLNKTIKYRSKLLKDLRQRFRNEYLSQLIQKHNEKESRDPQIGEIVLVGDDNKKRLFWALAKIIELIPGRGGKIRTVRLKTQHGKMLRPIQRIYPLEIRSNENLQRGMEESIPTVSETLSPGETSSLILTKVTQHLVDAPATEFLEHQELEIPYLENNSLVYDFEDVIQASELNKHLHDKQMDRLRELLNKYSKCFSNNPGLTNLVEHEIQLVNDQPVRTKPYRMSHRQNEILKNEINRMLKLGIIEVGESDYMSPMILVEVAGKEPRPCIDYRKLNGIIRTEYFPLPNIEERVEKVSAAKFITVLDLSKGYWQIPLSKTAQRYAAFCTSFGTYRPLRMSFGLKNAPYFFSKLMAELLNGLEDFVVPYLDDIAIFSDTWESHIKHMEMVLQRIKIAKLTIKPSKCKFAQQNVKFLGHIVGQGFRTPSEIKVQAVLAFPTPRTKTRIRAFLGLAGYYQKYINLFSIIAAPLTDALKGRAKKGEITWTTECENAFRELKGKLIDKPILYAPNFE